MTAALWFIGALLTALFYRESMATIRLRAELSAKIRECIQQTARANHAEHVLKLMGIKTSVGSLGDIMKAAQLAVDTRCPLGIELDQKCTPHPDDRGFTLEVRACPPDVAQYFGVKQ